MKSSSAILAVLLAASMAMAQSTATQTQAPSQSGQAQGQTGTQNAPKNVQAQPLAGGGRVLQAKSQDELKAYQDASAKTDPAEMEAAADAFAAKYPNSEMKGALFVRAMGLYAQTNNSEKLIAAGRKAIAADPTNPVPLVQVASVLAESTRDTDLDREQRLNEAAKDAQAAIDNINTGLIVPPNAPPEKVASAKANILMMAYDALGMIDMNTKDFAAAERDLLKAADASKATPEAVIYLRLSVAQDQLKKYSQALDSANKAVQYSQEGSAARNYAKQQQSRVKTLMDAGSPSGPAAAPTAAPVAPAPAKSTTQPSTQAQPATPPH
jgi:tetratricopeptide (TPR) repeat protein